MQQGTNEVFSLIGNVLETFLVKLKFGRGHEGKGLSVAVSLKRRFSAQPAGHKAFKCLHANLRLFVTRGDGLHTVKKSFRASLTKLIKI